MLHVKVDRNWLQNRLYGGPTAEELRPLAVPDPQVALKFNCGGPVLSPAAAAAAAGGGTAAAPHRRHSSAASVGSASAAGAASSVGTAKGRRLDPQARYDFNTAFGLHYRLHPDTLLPEYRHEVNLDQLFGRCDPMGSLAAGREVREEFSAGCLMDAMFSAEPAAII